MADRPVADIVADAETVRRLLRSHPAVAASRLHELPLRLESEGWDCRLWRVGEHLAVRLPRRTAAAGLIRHEQQVLPAIARRMTPTALRVPVPVIACEPSAHFPHPWSVVPWIAGTSGLGVPRSQRTDWAIVLGAGLSALHIRATGAFPVNPFRGVPLATRDGSVRDRLDRLRAEGRIADSSARTVARAWSAGTAAPVWGGRPVWIHGDLHPANLVATGSTLRALIDFGDVTAGDPAYDLAAAWIVFDSIGRRRFVAAMPSHDRSTWVRARAWAAAVAVLMLSHSDDAAGFAALAHETIEQLRQ
jgi:aminoglycoside phosphotransferase (APT) family kinase protein